MSTFPAMDTQSKRGSDESATQAELARRCLYYMSLMREMEDRIERKLYRQGKILGGVYVGRGQEAIPSAGAAFAARGRAAAHHRDMAVFFIPALRSAASSPSTWGARADSPAAATATCTWAI